MASVSDDFNRADADLTADGKWVQIRSGTRRLDIVSQQATYSSGGGGAVVLYVDEGALGAGMAVQADMIGLDSFSQIALYFGGNGVDDSFFVRMDNFNDQFAFGTLTNNSTLTNQTTESYASVGFTELTGDHQMRVTMEPVQAADDVNVYIDDSLVWTASSSAGGLDYRSGYGGLQLGNSDSTVDNFTAYDWPIPAAASSSATSSLSLSL